MNENLKISVELSLQDIQVLQNIISNSTPTYNFATITQFVGNINKQIQEKLKEVQESELPQQVEPANTK